VRKADIGYSDIAPLFHDALAYACDHLADIEADWRPMMNLASGPTKFLVLPEDPDAAKSRVP
jgi:hypothetical protein